MTSTLARKKSMLLCRTVVLSEATLWTVVSGGADVWFRMFILALPYCWYAGLAVNTAIAMPSFRDGKKRSEFGRRFIKIYKVFKDTKKQFRKLFPLVLRVSGGSFSAHI